MTGYAQVYGKYNTTPYDKLKLDLTYIENYSFLLDLQLIATTVKILFQKENTEGVDQWQTTASKRRSSRSARIGHYAGMELCRDDWEGDRLGAGTGCSVGADRRK